jgi:L-cysteine S-thiosulfotransferase
MRASRPRCTAELGRAAALALLVGLTPVAAQERAPIRIEPIRIENGEIARPLTDEPGNPGRGRLIVRDTARATCLICHALPIPEEPDHGEVGPSLAGVGKRYTPGQLRLRLVDPKAINPDTIMPSYYRVENLYRVLDTYRGQPIYTAQQIEDVVAYLAQLRD